MKVPSAPFLAGVFTKLHSSSTTVKTVRRTARRYVKTRTERPRQLRPRREFSHGSVSVLNNMNKKFSCPPDSNKNTRCLDLSGRCQLTLYLASGTIECGIAIPNNMDEPASCMGRNLRRRSSPEEKTAADKGTLLFTEGRAENRFSGFCLLCTAR